MPELESREICGWGRYPRTNALLARPASTDQIRELDATTVIARGQGRSYGDAAMLTGGVVIETQAISGQEPLEDSTGLITAEAGVTLGEILRSSIGAGWFPAVVPGTRHVSLGGAVAADIHGKNHHRDGSFGDHVTELEIMLANGESVRCSAERDPELFWATIGGMGLTGIITKVVFKMIPIETPRLIVRHQKAKDLEAALALSASNDWDDHYTVAWLDCTARSRSLGRGVFMSGHHARLEELSAKLRGSNVKIRNELRLPVQYLTWLLNSFTVGAFNEFYYRFQGSRSGAFVSDYETFFFPLDRIANWNRMYGKRGFVQYQCVLPTAQAERGLQLLLEQIKRRKRSSFLAVLKRFGPQNNGLLSFPMSGYTLTLDFGVSKELFPFLEQLDEIVMNHGGRVYLAKDARLRPETFAAMYPRVSEWLAVKSKIDPQNRFRSDLATRLGLLAGAHANTRTGA